MPSGFGAKRDSSMSLVMDRIYPRGYTGGYVVAWVGQSVTSVSFVCVSVTLSIRAVKETGQVVGFGDRSTGRGNFVGKYGAPHCNKWGTFVIGNSHCAAARLLPGEFLEL